MYQRQYQRLQPQTTAHLAQTMTLLNMNLEDLRIEIDRALNENPALVVEEQRYCATCHRRLAENQVCPVCSRPKDLSSDEAVVFMSPSKDFYPKSGTDPEDFFSDEILGSETLTLEEYVLQQVILELDEEEQIIAAYILNQLDEDGFFKESRENLASYYHVSVQKIEDILSSIQKSDPAGVGTASPIEAIQVQLRILNDAGEIPDLYLEIADHHLEDLLRKRFKDIATVVNISVDEVIEISDFFSENLNPFPAHAHWGSFRHPSVDQNQRFTSPDVIISYFNNDVNLPLVVEVVTPNYGNLTVNPLYQEAIKDSDEETGKKLKEDYDRANLFIKCLQQRNNTMLRLLQLLVNLQKEFIKNGDKFIIPITRVQISKEMDVHESTISRAVSSKTVQLPNGQIIPMSTFFDRSLGIRAELKEIISQEDKMNPYSDAELVKKLLKRGHKVARRTVAKYRALEGILAAHQRKSTK